MAKQRDVVSSKGYNQEGIVKLLDKMTGRIWIPIDSFSDIGNATLVATGTTTTVGLTFDKDTDEHASYNLVPPKDLDVTKAILGYVYWSSAGTSSSETFLAGLSVKGTADTEDIGDTHVLTLSTADANSATADALRITPAITIAADTLASTEELLSMSLYRDVSGDDAGEDVTVYGLRLDYTPRPFVKTSD